MQDDPERDEGEGDEERRIGRGRPERRQALHPAVEQVGEVEHGGRDVGPGVTGLHDADVFGAEGGS